MKPIVSIFSPISFAGLRALFAKRLENEEAARLDSLRRRFDENQRLIYATVGYLVLEADRCAEDAVEIGVAMFPHCEHGSHRKLDISANHRNRAHAHPSPRVSPHEELSSAGPSRPVNP